MGISVSASKAVWINDQHEMGVNTSIEANPTRGRLKGIDLLHVFSRNQNGSRRDDGNPLIFALKGMRGFSITAFWERQLMTRAKQILVKVAEDLEGFDLCVPIPSSSPFCANFAKCVSEVSGASLLEPYFLRKTQVGELLTANRQNPPRLRSGLKTQFTSQMHAWEQMDPSSYYQAKEVNLQLRHVFQGFVLDGEPPMINGKRILIVDDLFASGSSILAAREILQNQLGAEVRGICFLSGV